MQGKDKMTLTPWEAIELEKAKGNPEKRWSKHMAKNGYKGILQAKSIN